jgi:transposase
MGRAVKGGRDGGMGRSRGGLTSKIHALVDAEGRPIRITLTPGQAHDNTVAEELLGDLKPGTTLLADKAYDSNAIRQQAQEQDVWANIPPKSNRKGSFVFSATRRSKHTPSRRRLAASGSGSAGPRKGGDAWLPSAPTGVLPAAGQRAWRQRAHDRKLPPHLRAAARLSLSSAPAERPRG